MSNAHRNGDSRSCGATTVVSGQSFVTVEGQLWAVDKDPNSHGGGALNASTPYITISGKKIVIAGDSAAPDSLCPIPGGNHCNPAAVGFSSLIKVG